MKIDHMKYKELIFKNKTLSFSNNIIYIMGILNVTPDSFSDGGKFNKLDTALFQAEKMINDGADIIDIGGESTRPFSEPVSEDEELSRVIPVIEAVNENFKTIISIDTYKSKIAEEAVKSGAEIINDISGLSFDKNMEKIILKYNTPCVIMHIKGTPKNMQNNPDYDDVVIDIYNFFKQRINDLNKNGIEKIILDVGFGFGKSLDDNYKLLKKLTVFKDFNYPILTGISRKSMIGKIIDIKPEERISSTVALNAIAIANGTKIIRVHDVKENFQAVKVIEKYLDTK